MVKRKIDKKIKKIMKHFDFEKVHRVIELLDWKWKTEEGLEVPSVKQLKKYAKKQLENVVDNYKKKHEDLYISSGGFETRIEYSELHLRFIVEDMWEEFEWFTAKKMFQINNYADKKFCYFKYFKEL